MDETAAGSADMKAKVRAFLGSPKGIRLIVILGFAGMAIILLSQLWPSGRAAPTGTEAEPDAYAARLEAQLTELVAQIDGVGSCRVMVTLENGIEHVYASQSVLLTERLPTVRGVVVVCDGGNDPVVQQQVRTAVMTALHITSRRVCVAKSG